MTTPEQTPGFFELIGTVGAGVAGWVWKQVASKVSREELKEAIEAMERRTEQVLERVDEHYLEARESRDRLYQKIDEMNRAQGATMIALSGLQGRLDEQDKQRESRR